MADIVLASPWQPALQRLAVAGVPVLFGAGRRDPVPVRDRAEELAAHYTNVTAEETPGLDMTCRSSTPRGAWTCC